MTLQVTDKALYLNRRQFIGAAIGLYLLFQIRPSYLKPPATKKHIDDKGTSN